MRRIAAARAEQARLRRISGCGPDRRRAKIPRTCTESRHGCPPRSPSVARSRDGPLPVRTLPVPVVPRGDRERSRPRADRRGGRRAQGLRDTPGSAGAARIPLGSELHGAAGTGHLCGGMARGRAPHLVEGQPPALRSGPFRIPAEAGHGASQRLRRDPVRAGRVCRGRSRLRDPLSLRRGVRHPRALRPQHVSAPRARPRQPRGEALDDAQRPVLPLRARARRNAHGPRRRPRLPEPDLPRRRAGRLLRSRQEVHLHGDELPAAGRRAPVDALLEQHRLARRPGHHVRPFRDREDHPVRRSEPPPHRGRRDRMDGRGPLEPRGRLLREAHQPRQGGGAGHRVRPVDGGDDHRERAVASGACVRRYGPPGPRPP